MCEKRRGEAWFLLSHRSTVCKKRESDHLGRGMGVITLAFLSLAACHHETCIAVVARKSDEGLFFVIVNMVARLAVPPD